MTTETALVELEAMNPPVVLFPEGKPFPISPTAALRRLKKWGSLYAEANAILRETQAFLPVWGWCRIVTPRIAYGEDVKLPHFKGTKSMAAAIAKIDPTLQPILLMDEWMLTHQWLPGRELLVETVAFWLGSRHQAFLAFLEEMDDGEAEVSRAPVVFARSLSASPETPIQ